MKHLQLKPLWVQLQTEQSHHGLSTTNFPKPIWQMDILFKCQIWDFLCQINLKWVLTKLSMKSVSKTPVFHFQGHYKTKICSLIHRKYNFSILWLITPLLTIMVRVRLLVSCYLWMGEAVQTDTVNSIYGWRYCAHGRNRTRPFEWRVKALTTGPP